MKAAYNFLDQVYRSGHAFSLVKNTIVVNLDVTDAKSRRLGQSCNNGFQSVVNCLIHSQECHRHGTYIS